MSHALQQRNSSLCSCTKKKKIPSPLPLFAHLCSWRLLLVIPPRGSTHRSTTPLLTPIASITAIALYLTPLYPSPRSLTYTCPPPSLIRTSTFDPPPKSATFRPSETASCFFCTKYRVICTVRYLLLLVVNMPYSTPPLPPVSV